MYHNNCRRVKNSANLRRATNLRHLALRVENACLQVIYVIRFPHTTGKFDVI